LDQLLFDLKYDPSIIEIPVPRYFKEQEDNIEVRVALKEAVERGGLGGKVKKKKAAAKKKGKKKKKVEEEIEDKMTLKKMINTVKQAYEDALELEEPDIVHERVHDLLDVEMSIEHAIKLLQVNERGR
jgi:hypothetical protein